MIVDCTKPKNKEYKIIGEEIAEALGEFANKHKDFKFFFYAYPSYDLKESDPEEKSAFGVSWRPMNPEDTVETLKLMRDVTQGIADDVRKSLGEIPGDSNIREWSNEKTGEPIKINRSEL